MRHEEHNEQVALMQWWRIAHGVYPESALFAIPNGGARDPVGGARLKAEGVRAGVPDLFLAIPSDDSHGLWIELKKRKGGKVSNAQSEMMGMLTDQGYAVRVCHGWIEARTAILEYLDAGKR